VDHYRDTAQVTTLHPEHSQNDSMHVEANANVNVNRFTLPKDPREIIVAVVLALSIMVNLWCGWVIRDVGTRKWLHDYDLNQFQMGPFAQTQKDVEVTKELVKTYGVSNQTCPRK
jgi:hypothetical protein